MITRVRGCWRRRSGSRGFSDYHWGTWIWAGYARPDSPRGTLCADFLEPFGLTANRLAIELQAPATRAQDIVRSKRAISAHSALGLARYFGPTPQFWMNLQQANHDMERAEDAQGREIAERIRSHQRPDPRAQAAAGRSPIRPAASAEVRVTVPLSPRSFGED
jgi:antitoxin HigA-1